MRSARNASAIGWNQLGQLDSPLDVRLTFAASGGDRRRRVGGVFQLQQGTEAERLLQRMNVLALQIFNALRFDGGGIGQCDHAHRDGIEGGEFGGTQAPCSCDHFVFALLQLAHQKGRENALALEAGGKFLQPFFAETAAGIGGRLNQRGNRQVAVFGNGVGVC